MPTNSVIKGKFPGKGGQSGMDTTWVHHKPPDDLKDEERAVWLEVEPCLNAAGVLSSQDVPALRIYCQLKVLYDRALANVGEQDLITFNASGTEVQNPNVRIMLDLSDKLSKIWDRFGMTPFARTKIQVQEKTKRESKFSSNGCKPIFVD